MANLPKATLYYYPRSVWSAVALLALEEKGYGADEVDLRIVDITKGENYDPAFLRLNPGATVPTLLVPYENSLTEDVESRYKALTEAKTIVEFLDKSRSANSRTQTTSRAPAPMLTPATIATMTISKVIIDDILHTEIANPNILRHLNGRDDTALKTLAQELLPSLTQKQQALEGFLSQANNGTAHVSDKVKLLWKDKLERITAILKILEDAGKTEQELTEAAKESRAGFFTTARKVWEVNLETVLRQLSKEMVGPYTLGDQFSLADLHLAAWLGRIAKLCGGTSEDDGKTIVRKLEEYIGGGFRLPREFLSEQTRRENANAEKQACIGAFWDVVRERASWKKIYGSGLY